MIMKRVKTDSPGSTPEKRVSIVCKKTPKNMIMICNRIHVLRIATLV